MSNTRLITLLTDALHIARQQRLPALAAHLEQAIRLAHLETAQPRPRKR